MAKKVTLADIAKKVGVSNVAVSKALTGKPGVSEELREKIKKIAKDLGYQASASGRRSVKETTGNIGVIVPENYYGYSISFYGQLYEKVVRALYDNQHYGILELLKKEDEIAGTIPKVMQDGKVDGLIFLGQMDENYVRKMISQTNVPVFFLDTYLPNLEFDTVVSDGYYGSYKLTGYLIGQGHRKIAYVGKIDATSSISDRYWGYRKALRENKITFQKSWEISDRDEKGVSYEQIIKKAGDVDAYVCNCDFTAHLLIKNLEELGYRVPEDISVVGFDNFLPLGMNMDTEMITTYAVDMDRMAEVCVKSLIRKIERQPYPEGLQIVSGNIVYKRSVKERK